MPHDPANPNSGRIVDLEPGFDFDAAQLSQVELQQFDYTAQPDNDPNPIPGVDSAWRTGSYDPDFVYKMPQPEQDAIIAQRVRQATELANPISATLRRHLYPGSFIISGFDPGTSNETLNVLAGSLTLTVNDGNLAINPQPSRGIAQAAADVADGVRHQRHANQPSLLTQEQKELTGFGHHQDVVGIQYCDLSLPGYERPLRLPSG